MIDADAALQSLWRARPMFHSEDDFKFALAWRMQQIYPKAEVRLERPIMVASGRFEVDIVVRLGSERLAMELKYKTKALICPYGDEIFVLRDQLAPDQGRYDYCRDICRLESLLKASAVTRGCAVLLTNEPQYWSTRASANAVDAAFRIHEGMAMSGILRWSPKAGPGTTRGRTDPITLAGSYTMGWKDYVQLKDGESPVKAGVFRYLLTYVQ